MIISTSPFVRHFARPKAIPSVIGDNRDSIEQALAAEPRRHAVATLPATKTELEAAWHE